MKNKLYVLLLLLCSYRAGSAQYVTIPDDKFREYLQVRFPECFSGVLLDTTCTSVSQASFIYITGSITSLEGLQYFRNVTDLRCNSTYLTSIPPLPSHLKKFECKMNSFGQLPALPETLEELDCSYNGLGSLPPLPAGLQKLVCLGNQIIQLPTLPTTLQYLDCSNNPLMQLRPLPSLSYLNIDYDWLTTLPDLPASLKEFHCDHNHVSVLPALPDSLKILFCAGNKLTMLPVLPHTLLTLTCDQNKLPYLPALPDSLSTLECTFNYLPSLPPLPTTLKTLKCSHNHITSLPAMPPRLSVLYFDYNQVDDLPYIPPTLLELSCVNNPISCLPRLPYRMFLLEISATNITCLPNEVFEFWTYFDFPTMTVCANPDGVCVPHASIHGRVYNDVNNNGAFDEGEPLIPGQEIIASPGKWIGSTDGNGEYLIKLDTGIANSFHCVSSYKYTTVTPSSYSVNPGDAGLLATQYDFGMHLAPDAKDLEISLSATTPRAGNSTMVYITVNNVGTTDQSNVTITLKKPTDFSALNYSFPPTSETEDSITWSGFYIPAHSNISFVILLQIPTSIPVGYKVIYEAWVRGLSEDNAPADNYATWTEVIRRAVDPNDKLVNKDILPYAYDGADPLVYTIRFQNTGNDTAFYVLVRDIIPSYLDITTLRVISASHPYQLMLRDKNIVEVTFPNIQLPDSTTNEVMSHGYVQLSMRPKAGLPANTHIENKASIYFDYNAPVITNTATTKVQITTSIPNPPHKTEFNLFPNPVSENITVKLAHATSVKWQLCDLNGKIIRRDDVLPTETFDVDVHDVAAGTFILSMEMNGETTVSKVMIVR